MAEEAKVDPVEEQTNKDAASTGNERWVIVAQQRYGYFAAFLTHPEIGPLLRKAAENGWTKETLQGELYKTDWWQKSSATARDWQLLQSSDPAEARNRLAQKEKSLRILANQQGLKVSDSQIAQVASASLIFGMDDALVNQALFASVKWNPKSQPRGVAGQQMANISARAAAYGVGISDELAFRYARSMAMGDMTADHIEVDLRNKAKGRYTYLASDIDRGFTVRDILDPYIQQYAELMEVAPNDVNFDTPAFRNYFEERTEKGRGLMSLTDSATKVRQSKGWQQTRQAQGQAAELAESVLRQFGKVKV